ncbi:G2/mitotic-specific cyclin-B3 like [Actinidia chinensis var. chinensis]|uniref:G2/mitotic-specific cyclin-B3 like n=1 Tax=Actinidia chinensis var. chinensis TaxID=1590841 RepID=A0A2R6RIT6_ACTCC|nr:G2/mitotic-specific cyclin-B3 like [Actinidia chinensis var. chinensis]
METPSSTRRATRSQTLVTSNSNVNNNKTMPKKIEDYGKGVSKSRQDRSAFIDITNNSPIVGLAKGKLETPISATSKKSQAKNTKTCSTPGSGEALLRGQVKTLLQKVEEEAELSKISFEQRHFSHPLSLVNSPTGLLAPTPVNTPHVMSLSDHESFKKSCLASVTPSPVQEQLTISQMVTEILVGIKQEEEGTQYEKSLITRSLLLDFSEKSETSNSSECSSVLTQIEGVSESKEKTMEENDCSVWSVQVNASTTDDEEENDYDEAEEEERNGLCEEMSKISVNGGEEIMPKFSGQHTRFVYNSDDELEGVESEESSSSSSSSSLSGIVRLKGLPTPKGKHLRFPEEEEDN